MCVEVEQEDQRVVNGDVGGDKVRVTFQQVKQCGLCVLR